MSEPRIVVGVDGSEHSKRALRWAAYVAGLTPGTRVEALMVWEPPASFGFQWKYLVPNWDPMIDMQKSLRQVIDDVFGADAPPHLTLHTVEGHPAAQLLKAGMDAEMLIVGSRGHGTLASLVLGAVSERCIRHSRCPVLVVHDTDPPVADAEPAPADGV